MAAPAKINLCLEVLGERLDGYHEVRMLMACVSVWDTLTFELWPEPVMECDLPGLKCDASNLVLRAARLLQKEAGQALGARIHLAKRIPVGAGLAGGSADAAATLLGLNQLWKLGLDRESLEKLGATLGSDIPFCVSSAWALATGHGERLEPLKAKSTYHVVLLNPGFQVGTKWVYDNLPLKPQTSPPNLSRQVFEALEQGDFGKAELLAVNDLEAATCPAHPVVNEMKSALGEQGSILTRMSGSGPTVWGLFKDEAASLAAEKALKSEYSFVQAVHTLFERPQVA